MTSIGDTQSFVTLFRNNSSLNFITPEDLTIRDISSMSTNQRIFVYELCFISDFEIGKYLVLSRKWLMVIVAIYKI